MGNAARGLSGFRDFFVRAVCILLVLAVVGFLFAQNLSERRRQQALDSLKKPESLERYDRLVSAASTRPSDSGQSVRGQDANAEATAGTADWGNLERLARWAHLLARWERFASDKRKDGWEAVDAIPVYDDKSGDWRSVSDLSREEWTLLESCLTREQDLVRETKEVSMLGGPITVLDLSAGSTVEIRHHSSLRMMSKFLAWDAICKAHAGDSEAAVETILTAMRLGDALLDEPLLYSQDMHKMIYREAVWALREGMDPGRIPSEGLQRILNALSRADGRMAFADALRGEAYIRVRDFASLRQGNVKDYGFISLNNHPYSVRSLHATLVLRVYASPVGAPWFNADEAAMAGTIERIASCAERPYYQVKTELASIDEQLASLSFARVFSSRMLQDYRSPLTGQAGFEAMMDLTRIGLLVQQRRTLNGKFPEALEEIASEFGGTLPVDPFSGKGYRYVVKDGSFLLYSVGKNLQDDGGKPDWQDGDLLWR